MSAAVTILSPAAWPGEDREAANFAALDVLASPPSGVAGVPGLLMLPARGPASWSVGRAFGVVESMPAQLEPHGWRLASRPGTDQRQARRMLEGDVESFALALAGYDGVVQVPILGPFSLAAATWLRVGERAIGDPAARADLIAALGLGVERLLERLASARGLSTLLPGPGAAADPGVGPADVVPDADRLPNRSPAPARVLLQEPWLAQILSGTLPSFSGRANLPALRPETVLAGLAELLDGWTGWDVAIQVQPDPTAFVVAASAEPAALRLDPASLGGRAWEALAELIEAGLGVEWAGVPLAGAGRERLDPGVAAREVLRPLRQLGLQVDHVNLALVSGIAAQTPIAASASLAGLARTAVALGDLLAQ